MKFKSITLFCVLVLSFPSHAGQWSGWGYVTEIQTYAGNSFRFKTSAPFKSDGTACGSGWYFVSDFTGYKKEQVSMVLAAFAAKQDIRVNVSGCGGYSNTDTSANYFHIRK